MKKKKMIKKPKRMKKLQNLQSLLIQKTMRTTGV